MSINFEKPIDDETRSLMEELLGEPVAKDAKTALYDNLNLAQQKMKKIANKAKQPVQVEVHDIGDIKTMEDGTQYRVTERGWVKIADE